MRLLVGLGILALFFAVSVAAEDVERVRNPSRLVSTDEATHRGSASAAGSPRNIHATEVFTRCISALETGAAYPVIVDTRATSFHRARGEARGEGRNLATASAAAAAFILGRDAVHRERNENERGPTWVGRPAGDDRLL